MKRLAMVVILGAALLGGAAVASIFSPQNGFLIILVGLMMFMHLFGHGGHGGGHSHGNSEEAEHSGHTG